MSDLQYVIIGAGGTGGGIGAYMAAAGKHVTLIARGAHLAALNTQGLRLETTTGEPPRTIPVRAFSMETYPENEHPDVIFVCVKGYSLESVYPFISGSQSRRRLSFLFSISMGPADACRRDSTDFL